MSKPMPTERLERILKMRLRDLQSFWPNVTAEVLEGHMRLELPEPFEIQIKLEGFVDPMRTRFEVKSGILEEGQWARSPLLQAKMTTDSWDVIEYMHQALKALREEWLENVPVEELPALFNPDTDHSVLRCLLMREKHGEWAKLGRADQLGSMAAEVVLKRWESGHWYDIEADDPGPEPAHPSVVELDGEYAAEVQKVYQGKLKRWKENRGHFREVTERVRQLEAIKAGHEYMAFRFLCARADFEYEGVEIFQ
jgi:hypothetical protein